MAECTEEKPCSACLAGRTIEAARESSEFARWEGREQLARAKAKPRTYVALNDDLLCVTSLLPAPYCFGCVAGHHKGAFVYQRRAV